MLTKISMSRTTFLNGGKNVGPSENRAPHFFLKDFAIISHTTE